MPVMDSEPLAPPAPNAPSGHPPPDLDALIAEVGASYPLLGYVLQPDEPYDEDTPLDPVIFAGLLRP
jgi:hypothetical protein